MRSAWLTVVLADSARIGGTHTCSGIWFDWRAMTSRARTVGGVKFAWPLAGITAICVYTGA